MTKGIESVEDLPCFKLGLYEGGSGIHCISNCPDNGSSDCPLTMKSDLSECEMSVDSLSETLSFYGRA